ncbi:MAG: aminotransferase class III-fold pyridoxal phosphate-dependent enzyme [Streptococcaceae bacterium]|jgi:taurine--2-oxoglutarate transaminase|nr:aminotransferase class III-fold pyridoxal phosphate-dependent enzyme [Streptococcaceae bacterium]
MTISEEQIKEYQKDYILTTWSKQKDLTPIVVDKAKGIYFYDEAGTRYTDMSSQLVNMNVGFGVEKINQAIKDQLDEYAFIAPTYASKSRSELAKKVIDLLPEEFGKIFFTNAGAEANENAIKIAKMYTGRNKIFSRYRSYHGSTLGAGNLTGEPRRFALEPGAPGFVKFFDPYIYREAIEFDSEEAATNYYIAKLREQILYEGGQNVAAIVLETVTGSNGVIIPPKGYLPAIRQLCDEFGILMICDEVMVGFGRTGKLFAFQNFDVIPDIITFAKGITCGYVPLGGVIVRKEIAEKFDETVLSAGLTYSGHPLACAAGVACVDYYYEENIFENVQNVGSILGETLEAFKQKHKSVGDVRYIGLISAVELVKNKTTKEPLVAYGQDPDGIMKGIIGELKKRRFMTYSHENIILIAPPLVITEAQLTEELKKLDEVLTIVDETYTL